MNVCLIGPPTVAEFSERDAGRIASAEAARIIAEHAPLGVLSLAAVLEHQGLAPGVSDLNQLYYRFQRDHATRGADFAQFAAEQLALSNCDLFGFSTLCSSYPVVLRIAEKVKRLRPRAMIVLGGPQASVVDVATLRAFRFVDMIVRGEAEESFPQLVRALALERAKGAKAAAEIPGITLRRGGEIVRNPDAPLIADLDSLPHPAWHLLPPIEEDCNFLPLELGRGCPFACTFCSTNDFFRRRYRLKSPARVLNEMRRLKAAYGADIFDLVHDMFTVDRKRVEAFCRAMLEAPEKFYWGCSARTDCIDDELIELMAQAGCRGIFFGIETGSARMQKIIDKGLDLKQSRARVQACSRSGIKTAVSLIAGFPEETMKDLRDTAAFFMDSLAIPLADPQLCILAPLAETPIHRQHKHRLQLDDAPIDMAYRGWDQAPADRELILAHPDIFPNFYTVPTPFLDHEFLKELRDFLLNGSRGFPGLLLQLHEISGDIVEVFARWRLWRAENKGAFPGDDRSAYYAQESFPQEFLEFVGELIGTSAQISQISVHQR
jgi:radical SAM superfamily enzyme YgiQ (UPF0313 family)